MTQGPSKGLFPFQERKLNMVTKHCEPRSPASCPRFLTSLPSSCVTGSRLCNLSLDDHILKWQTTTTTTKNTQTKTLNNNSQDYFEDERVGFTEAFSSKSNGYSKCSAV